MKIKKLTVQENAIPKVLQEIPDPPKELYICGNNLDSLLDGAVIALVGSRKVSVYGKTVTIEFARQLAGAGATIVSGLAIGVDALAHSGALEAGGRTLAVLAGGLDVIYPSRHRQLAMRIIEQGGALISEYPPGMPPLKHQFIARNRLVSGLSQGVIITEAAKGSGSLHTANFALEQGREVMAVPGNITSPVSGGTNQLIRTGATPVTSPQEVLDALGLAPVCARTPVRSNDPCEAAILEQLQQGTTDGNELLAGSGLSVARFNQALTMLEIKGTIRALGANNWTL